MPLPDAPLLWEADSSVPNTVTKATLSMMDFSLNLTIDAKEVLLTERSEVEATLALVEQHNESHPASKFKVEIVLNPLNDISTFSIA